jgi:putative transcriptional regulator
MSKAKDNPKGKSKTRAARPEGMTFGESLIAGLTEFRDVLASGEPLEKHFVVRRGRIRITPSKYGPADIKKVREKLGVSQGTFAEFLGVTPLTVSAWELGRRKASKTVCRYLDDVQEFPELWSRRMSTAEAK